MTQTYKFLACGNDAVGALQFFGKGQMREAEQWCADASKMFGASFGVKRIELDEAQVLAMINSNILLQKMMQAKSGK
jgi:hypothetical protein